MRIVCWLVLLLFSLSYSYGQLLVGPKLGVHAREVQFEKQSFQNQFDPNLKIGFNIGLTFHILYIFAVYIRQNHESKY